MTPMMRQYLKTKEEYRDTILFYRLGDFYEMFFEDAKLVSRELELTLTGKDCGMSERAPMCGIPFHSASTYIAKLIDKGYKVAICEQVEDPKEAKGLVKREVVRVITPGTIVDSELLSEKENNYLAVIYTDGDDYGLTFTDISTGEIYVTSVSDSSHVISEMARYIPSEILTNDKCPKSILDEILLRIKVRASVLIDEFFDFDDMDSMIENQFHSIGDLLSASNPPVVKTSVCCVLRYMQHTQKGSFAFLDKLNYYKIDEYMDIDAATRRNLEITETMRDKAKTGSLLWVLDRTKTSMGGRLLKQWLEKPLLDGDMIRKRLSAVEELTRKQMERDALAEALSGIYDMSRITSRIALGTVSPRDLVALRDSIRNLPKIKEILNGFQSKLFKELSERFDLLEDIREFLNYAINDDPPAFVRDGGVIKAGYDEELDKLVNAKNKGSDWVKELEIKERESTGIKTLKISYNRVFGYYIEVTKSFTSSVPDYYVRKQTLANAERYITPELKNLENTILGASEKILALESRLYMEIVKRLYKEMDRLKSICTIVAICDCICSFSTVSAMYRYVKPDICDDGRIEIRGGRHPVVEKMLGSGIFVPNDTTLDTTDNRMVIITGPNMAGKSTYMRQVAVISLMAQVGCFVPAEFARLSVVDKIFTRVGASDDIAAGQSTFMVEMSEVAHILSEATKNSLIILDEIGRGTSTYDGLSIAWSVVEYIHDKKKIGAKTLFATHYHELTQLEDKLDGVKNYNVAVKKRGDDITFLRKIIPGGADESYGIEVAALAGVPKTVIKRAKEILSYAESEKGGEIKIKASEKKKDEDNNQLDFGYTAAVTIAEELKKLDATTLTPIEALNKLYELSNKAKEI